MEIVVDVNVVISSLWKRGNSLMVFELNSLLNRFDFVAPDFLLKEFGKHKERISEESELSKEEFNEVLDFIFNQITFIPEAEFSNCIPGAKKKLSGNLKDVQYLALALKLKCPIFSGDKTFKELCPDKVLNPKEMLGKL